MSKFERAEDQKKKHFDDLRENLKFKKEVLRLKEQDKAELQSRLKRQAEMKKIMILMKEREHSEKRRD